eukprot:361896-Chlamydomonas_euryale.AAC.2
MRVQDVADQFQSSGTLNQIIQPILWPCQPQQSCTSMDLAKPAEGGVTDIKETNIRQSRY